MQFTKVLIAAMTLAAAGCGQPKTKVAQPVAKVNGQVITSADLDK